MSVSARFTRLNNAALDLVATVLSDCAVETDENRTSPRKGLDAVREVGLHHATSPDGGIPALTPLELCRIAETLGRGCPSTALCLMMHWISCLYMDTWVPDLTSPQDRIHLEALRAHVFAAVRRDALIANCYGEPGSGAAIHCPFTEARWSGERWVVTGTKFGTMADIADFIQLHAVVRSGGSDDGGIVQFVIPQDRAGVSVSRISDMVGVRGAAPLRVTFDACEVEDRERFGPIGMFDDAGREFPYAALLLAAPYLGVAQAALDVIVAHCSGRRPQGAGLFLAKRPELRMAIANMSVELEGARALLYRAAEHANVAATPEQRRLVHAAKVAVARMAVRVTQEAMQAGGARMLMREMPLERLMRDSHAAGLHPPSIPEALNAIADTLMPAPAPAQDGPLRDGAPAVVTDDLPGA